MNPNQWYELYGFFFLLSHEEIDVLPKIKRLCVISLFFFSSRWQQVDQLSYSVLQVILNKVLVYFTSQMWCHCYHSLEDCVGIFSFVHRTEIAVIDVSCKIVAGEGRRTKRCNTKQYDCEKTILCTIAPKV